MMILFFASLVSFYSGAQENPYDLLSSLSTEPTTSIESGVSRVPSSVSSDQIEVRSQLPEAKQRKTARGLQWEVLHKKESTTENHEVELEE